MMAFAARLGPLTEELVEALTNTNAKNDPARFKKFRDGTLKSLKTHPYLRTNQFEVEHNLDGLEERFRVNYRESLADALRDRLDTLKATPSKWHPEILFLLLELSDQPTFHSRLSDLEALRPPEQKASKDLRWETIAREDGWDQDGNLWKTIRYDDSSDDDFSYQDSADGSDLSSATDSLDKEPVGRTAQDLIIKPDDVSSFNAVRSAQEWRTTGPSGPLGQARKTAVTEIHVVREVLFMLQGLDTTLFDAKCVPVPSFQTSHLAWDTHKAVINHFAESGRQLSVLRRFVRAEHNTPHLQAFQDCVTKRLQDFDDKLSQIHTRLAAPSGTVIVSLVSVSTELTGWLHPLVALSDVLSRMFQDSTSGAFRFLELLFDEASVAQLSGDTVNYSFLARIFVECFNVYLRPIRLWMDEGRLLPNDRIFFVYETSLDIPLSEIWRSRYKLRRTEDEKLHVPTFLQPAVEKIMTAGKNIVILARLGQSAQINSRQPQQEPPLDYDTICPPGFDLAPFRDLFEAAFDRWIQSKYSTTSTTLKDTLFDKCGLCTSLDALQYLYLMSDGSAALSFCEDVFDRIDSLNPSWYDRYALTAIGHEAFGHLVDTSRLSISVDSEGRDVAVEKASITVRSALSKVKIDYRLAWPIQMILSPGSTEFYQTVFSLLLQFKRAVYILHKPKMLEHYWTDHDHWVERSLYYSCRNSLHWFCTTIQTYLSTLVLTPNTLKLREALAETHDVDSIIAVHDAFMKQVVIEACLGSRLTPIRECMLDVLDLAIKLEQPIPEDEYIDTLKGIKADFEKHLRFISEGLRSVARASSDSQGVKWDTLAEMLQMGEK